MTEEEEGEEEEEASLASVPSTKTNNLLMERSGTEEEELTLTMEWKTGVGGRIGISFAGCKGFTPLNGDCEGTVISLMCQEGPCRLACSPRDPTSWPCRMPSTTR